MTKVEREAQPDCSYCGGLHFGGPPNQCAYRCRRCGRDTRDDAVGFGHAKCECAPSLTEEKWPEKPPTNGPLRMFIALRVLRAWNNGTAGFSGIVVKTINDWIDGAMEGPIPYPDDPFFAEWAELNGFSKVGVYLGFRFQAVLSRDLIGEK